MTESVQAAAEQAPDAVQQHHDAAQQAQAVGDSAGANAHYQAELAARAGQPPPSPDAPTPSPDSSAGDGDLTIANPNGYGPPAVVSAAGGDEVGYAQTALSPWSGWNDGPSVDDLFSRWGGDAGANLGFASAFEDTHGDVAEVFMKWGLSGHPAVVEAAALMGRKYATQTGEKMVTDDTSINPNIAEDQIKELRARAAKAQSEGNSKEANRLFALEQALIARRSGNRSIVGACRPHGLKEDYEMPNDDPGPRPDMNDPEAMKAWLREAVSVLEDMIAMARRHDEESQARWDESMRRLHQERCGIQDLASQFYQGMKALDWDLSSRALAEDDLSTAAHFAARDLAGKGLD